ncbi:hypothetical protein D6C82_04424, partial [Aureobasidium pullulans]
SHEHERTNREGCFVRKPETEVGKTCQRSVKSLNMSKKGSLRPCDQCRGRKVRCNYSLPCDRCQSHNLACTFDIIRKKKGPKAGRGIVIDRLRAQSSTATPTPFRATTEVENVRETQPVGAAHSNHNTVVPNTEDLDNIYDGILDTDRNTIPTESDAGPDGFLDDTYLTFDEFAQNVLATSSRQLPYPKTDYSWPQTNHATQLATEQQSPFSVATASFLSPEISSSHHLQIDKVVERSVDLFFKHTYPIYPIVDQSSICSILSGSREGSWAETCQIWSICALTLVTANSWPGMSTEWRVSTARNYIRKCLETRLSVGFIETASIEDVLTSLFIAVTYFDLKCRKTSWYYLRESITLAHHVGISSSGRNTALDPKERLLYQRVCAILYITERGACIHDRFPISILEPPDLPCEALPNEDPAISLSLSGLFRLFSLLDINFIRAWSDLLLSDTTPQKLGELQKHLCQPLHLNGVNDVQSANILITQQWLRLMVWQTALRLGLISSTAADSAFSYGYPVEVASSLCEILKTLAPISIQVHGLGIFEKQFEIAYSLLDALKFSNISHPGDHHEVLRSLLLSLSVSPTSREVYVHILQRKMDQSEGSRFEQKYVHLADVQLLREGRGGRQNSRRESSSHSRYV